MILIYSTFPDKSSAEKMGTLLLKEKLICCSNIFPVTSQFEWNAELMTEEEYGAYFKTSDSNKEKAIQVIEKNHPYDVPMISYRAVVMNAAYQNWAESIMSHHSSH